MAAGKPMPLKRKTAEHSKVAPGKHVKKTRTSEIKQASKGTIWVQVASGGKQTEAQKTARRFIAQHADVIGTSSFTIEQPNPGNAGTSIAPASAPISGLRRPIPPVRRSNHASSNASW
jgi:hypothetical protein